MVKILIALFLAMIVVGIVQFYVERKKIKKAKENATGTPDVVVEVTPEEKPENEKF